MFANGLLVFAFVFLSLFVSLIPVAFMMFDTLYTNKIYLQQHEINQTRGIQKLEICSLIKKNNSDDDGKNKILSRQ